MDLASYLIESTIDYTVEDAPNYKIDSEALVNNFDVDPAVNRIFRLYLENFYTNHFAKFV